MFGYLILRNYTNFWTLTKLIPTVNCMMQQRQDWTPYIHMKSSKIMTMPSLIDKRKLSMYHKITLHLIFAVKYDGKHKLDL